MPVLNVRRVNRTQALVLVVLAIDWIASLIATFLAVSLPAFLIGIAMVIGLRKNGVWRKFRSQCRSRTLTEAAT
jgi:hypothetical protein